MIAEQADQDTIAILGQDSDFVIYQVPHHVKYLSILHFDFDALMEDHQTLRTSCYDRQALVECLTSAAERFGGKTFGSRRLEVGHLPLVASLRGNDLIESRRLQRFHNRLLSELA